MFAQKPNMSSSKFTHRITILAFGTRGDVQPLLDVTSQLMLQRFPASVSPEITFVTHSAHLSLAEDHFPSKSVFPVNFIYVSSPPGYRTANPGTLEFQKEHELEEEKRNWEKDQREKSIYASKGSFLIICNLFALEGVHIADAANQNLIIVSPCMIPYAMPASFERKFRRRWPDSFDLLRHRGPDEFSWRDVEHWAWALYSNQWQEWRRSNLGVTTLPFENYGDGRKPPVLLYGVSSHVFAAPGYWPSNAKIVGFMKSKRRGDKPLSSDILKFLRVSHISSTSDLVILVDFGAPGRLGAIASPHHLLSHILGWVLLEKKRQAIIQTYRFPEVKAHWQSILLAATEQDQAVLNNQVLLLESAVDYDLLLPLCSALIHHGGSGTTATALMHAKPQIIIPYMFDQFFWAEQISYLSLGISLSRHDMENGDFSGESAITYILRLSSSSTRPLTLSSGTVLFSKAMEIVTSSECMTSVKKIARKLEKEDGVQAVMDEVHSIMQAEGLISTVSLTAAETVS